MTMPGPARAAVLPSGGAWLRILLVIVCALIMANLFVHGQQDGQILLQWSVAVGLTLWVVIKPGASAPVALILLAVLMRIFFASPVLDGRLIALVLVLPLAHQLSALAVVIPICSAVQWPALIPTLARYLGAVSATMAGLGLSHWLGWW